MSKYRDRIYYNSINGNFRKEPCRITKIGEGLIYFESACDKKLHVIGTGNLIEIIFNTKEE